MPGPRQLKLGLSSRRPIQFECPIELTGGMTIRFSEDRQMRENVDARGDKVALITLLRSDWNLTDARERFF